VALVDEESLGGWQGGAGSAEVLVQADQRRYLVRAETPCLLVVSEVFYPWWRATLDEEDVQMALVNHAMIGIPVPAGSHVVRLRIAPRSVLWGGAISLVSLVVCVAFLGPFRRRRPARPSAGTVTTIH
jgi:hypothetical protein